MSIGPYGYSSALIRSGRSSSRPALSAKVHRPIKTSRAWSLHCARSSFLKKDGLIDRVRAMGDARGQVLDSV